MNEISPNQIITPDLARKQASVVKNDPMKELIDLQKNNNELLGKIAENTEIQISLLKKNDKREKHKKYLVIFKLLLWGGLIAASIYYTPMLIDTMMNQTMKSFSGMGEGGNEAGTGAVDPTNIQKILEGLDLEKIANQNGAQTPKRGSSQ